MMMMMMMMMMVGLAHPVGLDEAYEHGEEDRGGRGLAVLAKELYRLVKSVLSEKTITNKQ